MNMDAQGLSTNLLGVDASGEGQPVMGVNDVELLSTCHLTGDYRVVVDFLVQVAWVTAGKLHSAQVVDIHVVKVGIDMITQLEIVVGIHDVAYTLFHIVIVHITPGNGYGVHRHDAAGMLTLVAERVRQTEHCLNVALSLQTL